MYISSNPTLRVGDLLRPRIWSGLPAQVPVDGFEDARYIAAPNIVLPVHQDLTRESLDYIASALECAIAATR